MRNDTKPPSDYPNRKCTGFSDKAWKLMEEARAASGNTMTFLIREWCEKGAKNTKTEMRRKNDDS